MRHRPSILPYNHNEISALKVLKIRERYKVQINVPRDSWFPDPGHFLDVFLTFFLIGKAALPLMSLDLSDVQRLAKLAQIQVTDDQAERTLLKLNDIFRLVEQLCAVDTTGVEPLNHPIAAIRPDLALRLREDTVTETDRRADYQQSAPATLDGLYLVPKVLD